MRDDYNYQFLDEIYTDATNIVITVNEDILYVRYTVEDDTVLIDKWEHRAGELECISTVRV